MNLYERQRQIRKENALRKSVRKSGANFLGLWAFGHFVVTGVIAWRFSDQPIDSFFGMQIGLSAIFGAFWWFVITRIFDSEHPYYYPRLAEVVYCGYVSSKDEVGAEIDLDYALNNYCIRMALGVNWLIEQGYAVTLRDQAVSCVLPLTISHALLPNTAGVYVKTTRGTYQFGPSYFLEELYVFTAQTPNMEMIDDIQGYLKRYTSELSAYVTKAINEYYFGKPADVVTLFPERHN